MKPKETIERFDRFLAERDVNPDWPRHVDTVLEDLARRLDPEL